MSTSRDSEWRQLDSLFDELWPIPRSITGPGFRESLGLLQEHVPFEVESVPSGTEVFDWEIPPEWRIHDAKLTGPDGQVYADFEETNLAVMNYSTPVDESLPLADLEPHLYTVPHLPHAIPYVTSYYERNWGFCLSEKTYESLPEGNYHAYIDSELVDGELTFGHTVLQGESDREILLSSYLCHPSLANNELSGPLVLTSLYQRIANWDHRKFSYRFVIAPETIGALTYLWKYGGVLKDRLVSGLVLTCLGGPKPNLSYKCSRRGDALVDRTVRHLDEHSEHDFRFRRFDAKGSDERQYCSAGFNLPVGQFARTVYGKYDEYHNSGDSKEFMAIDPLVDSAERIEDVLRTLERSGYYRNLKPYGEPMMSKRDLYWSINSPDQSSSDEDAEEDPDRGKIIRNMMRILAHSDGQTPILEIAEQYDLSVRDLRPALRQLNQTDLLEPSPPELEYAMRYNPEEF